MKQPGKKGPGAGRPTVYDPSYIEQIKDFMGQGYSAAAFAGHIGVSRPTIYNWAKSHPEFFDALKVAQAMSALWWERKGRDLAMTGEGNASMIIFALKNRVSDEWRDRQEVDHQSSDGSMTPVTGFDIRVAGAPTGDADEAAG